MTIKHDMIAFGKFVTCLAQIGVEFEVYESETHYSVIFGGDDDTDVSFDFAKATGKPDVTLLNRFNAD